MSSQPAVRPGSVTVVVVIIWLLAIVSIAGGVVALIISDEELTSAGISESFADAYGWTSVTIGVLSLLVAMALSRGSSLARLLVSLLMVLRLATGLWAILSLPDGLVAGMVTIALAVLVLALLWNKRASAFFAAT